MSLAAIILSPLASIPAEILWKKNAGPFIVFVAWILIMKKMAAISCLKKAKCRKKKGKSNCRRWCLNILMKNCPVFVNFVYKNLVVSCRISNIDRTSSQKYTFTLSPWQNWHVMNEAKYPPSWNIFLPIHPFSRVVKYEYRSSIGTCPYVYYIATVIACTVQ